MKLAASILFILVGTAAAYGDERLDRLPPEDRKWLEEEVVYIITDREREVFLNLGTAEERRRFIEAFWAKRDPNPVTPENELREEHYRRIEHANRALGRETFRPGWRTDRGRMYIILGEPREIQRFEGHADLLPAELWFYQGEIPLGQPSFFYLLFFVPDDVGEFELYHPVVDGPNALFRGNMGIPTTDTGEALEALGRISPSLAQASLSFDTAETPDMISGRPSLGHDVLMRRLEESPKRSVRTDYADAYLRYGGMVSSDYSFNFVPSRSLFAVLEGRDGTPFVHYTLEIDPENFTLQTDEGKLKYYTTLDVSVEARSREGELVFSNNKVVYLEVTSAQLAQVRLSPFAYQDDFPLVAGDYRVSVILKNRTATQYTVAERDLLVQSRQEGKRALGELVLGFRNEWAAVGEGAEMRAFQTAGHRIYPATEDVFATGETMHLFSQVHETRPGDRARFAILEGERVVEERTRELRDDSPGALLETIPLTGVPGGEYRVLAQLMDAAGSVVAERSARLQVSPRTSIPRPRFVYQLSFDDETPGLLSLAKGEQLLNLRRLEEAKAELETAVAANPTGLPEARFRLAGIHIARDEPDPALELLLPMEAALTEQYEVVAGLGFAYYLKEDFARAIEYLERAMTLRPPDTLLLNSLGYSHLQLGNSERAREAFERSLSLQPGQSEVERLLASVDGSR